MQSLDNIEDLLTKESLPILIENFKDMGYDAKTGKLYKGFDEFANRLVIDNNLGAFIRLEYNLRYDERFEANTNRFIKAKAIAYNALSKLASTEYNRKNGYSFRSGKSTSTQKFVNYLVSKGLEAIQNFFIIENELYKQRKSNEGQLFPEVFQSSKERYENAKRVAQIALIALQLK